MENFRQRFGGWAEEVVSRHLTRHQWRLIDRHWQCRFGEIDIIAFDQAEQCLVFIEVRAKTSDSFGRPEDSITWRKKRSLARTIAYYVLKQRYLGHYRCDVCAVECRSRQVRLRHLKNVSLE